MGREPIPAAMGWAALHEIASRRAQLEARWLAAPRDLRKGMKKADVVRKYGVSEAFVSRWAKAPRKGGTEALRMRTIPGKTPYLTEGFEDGQRQDVGFLRMALSVIG